MDPRATFLSELIGDINEAVLERRWDDVSGELDALCEEIVSALVEGRDDAVATAADQIERAYSRAVTRNGLGDRKPDDVAIAAELQALTRLLSIALRHRRPEPQADLVDRQCYRPILHALRDARNGLSGRELARKTTFAAETIARRIPELRTSGLVRSWRAGRLMMNALTAEARELLAAQADAPADPPVVRLSLVLHDKIKKAMSSGESVETWIQDAAEQRLEAESRNSIDPETVMKRHSRAASGENIFASQEFPSNMPRGERPVRVKPRREKLSYPGDQNSDEWVTGKTMEGQGRYST